MHIYTYLALKEEELRRLTQEYKKLKKKKWVKIYDYKTHPVDVTNKEQMTLIYSAKDWLWFSEIFTVDDEDKKSMNYSYDITMDWSYSMFIFTINREDISQWYKRIKEFIDFLWTDYIAVWESLQSIFDLDTWEVIKFMN